MVSEYEAHCVLESSCDLGECCRWDEQRHELSWVDVTRGHFFRASVDGDQVQIVRSYQVDGFLSAVAPFRRRDDGWIIARHHTVEHLSEEGDREELCAPEPASGEVRLNDGACDPFGRFLIGSMAMDEVSSAGSLFRVTSSHCERLFGGVTISNGLGWSPDARHLYYVDSGPATIYHFDVDANGLISARRTLVNFNASVDGVPDGLCVDSEGALWVAMWDGRQVRRYSPNGELLATVRLPVSRPTSCAIGGTNGTTLYVTTARTGLSSAMLDTQTLAGGLFSVDVGVKGLPLNAFDPDAQS